MKNSEKFSIKKLLLCILCSVILTTSFGMTMLFIENAPNFIVADFASTINEESEGFKEYLREIEKGLVEGSNYYNDEGGLVGIDTGTYYYSIAATKEYINNFYKETRESYGEDYPVDGLLIHNMGNILNFIRTQEVVETYVLSLIIGIFLGTIVYIIAIQKAKGKKLILEIILALAIIVAIMFLVNLGYEALFNILMNSLEENISIGYNSYIYDFEDNRVFIAFAIILVVVFLGNFIKQKILTNKLNKEIEKIK